MRRRGRLAAYCEVRCAPALSDADLDPADTAKHGRGRRLRGSGGLALCEPNPKQYESEQRGLRQPSRLVPGGDCGPARLAVSGQPRRGVPPQSAPTAVLVGLKSGRSCNASAIFVTVLNSCTTSTASTRP